MIKEEKNAARYIIREYEVAKNFLFSEENKKTNQKINGIINERKIKELRDIDFGKPEPHLANIYSQGIMKERLVELRYLIWAFYFFINGKNEIEVLQSIGSKRWRFKHEVIIRLAWMRRQKVLILEENKFNHPFLCYVGSHKGRKNTDREFFSLKYFISLYARKRKTKYLFNSKQENPDFTIKDEDGNIVGVEITEANLPDSHLEDESSERLQEALAHIFRKEKFTLILRSKPNWTLVNENFNDVINWIKAEEAKAKISFNIMEEFTTQSIIYNIYICFKKAPSLYSFLDSGTEINGDISEQNLGKAVRERIESKIKKAKPSIRPCYLVIFIRASIPFMKTKIVKATARKGLGKNFRSHFDQIWAVKESKLFRVA